MIPLRHPSPIPHYKTLALLHELDHFTATQSAVACPSPERFSSSRKPARRRPSAAPRPDHARKSGARSWVKRCAAILFGAVPSTLLVLGVVILVNVILAGILAVLFGVPIFGGMLHLAAP